MVVNDEHNYIHHNYRIYEYLLSSAPQQYVNWNTIKYCLPMHICDTDEFKYYLKSNVNNRFSFLEINDMNDFSIGLENLTPEEIEIQQAIYAWKDKIIRYNLKCLRFI